MWPWAVPTGPPSRISRLLATPPASSRRPLARTQRVLIALPDAVSPSGAVPRVLWAAFRIGPRLLGLLRRHRVRRLRRGRLDGTGLGQDSRAHLVQVPGELVHDQQVTADLAG